MALSDILNKLPSTGTLLALGSGAIAVSHTMTQTGNPELAVIGLAISAFFKLVDGLVEAHVAGKKLDVEKQFIAITASPTPSLMSAAQDLGFTFTAHPPPPPPEPVADAS